jgi:hypothetical protein
MLQFNPPPGWPRPPEGWVPPPDWQPDPAWPPAPAGWPFYTDPTTPPPAAPVPRRQQLSTRSLGMVACALIVSLALIIFGTSVTGHKAFQVTVDGFSYSVEITKTDRVTTANSLIAKPGFSFIEMKVAIKNLQSDRSAPIIDAVQAIAAPPEIINIEQATFGPVRSCDVRGSGPGQVSTGIAGAPPGWCFFDVAKDTTGLSGPGLLKAAGSMGQTYYSSEAFRSDVDASLFHVYGATGGTESTRGRDLDLGAAG